MKLSKLLCGVGIHKYAKSAHWCDKECAVIIVEYTCSRCEQRFFDLIYFEPERMKSLIRVDSTLFDAVSAPNFIKCEQEVCDVAEQATPKKRKPKQTKKSKTSN